MKRWTVWEGREIGRMRIGDDDGGWNWRIGKKIALKTGNGRTGTAACLDDLHQRLHLAKSCALGIIDEISEMAK